jgi:hypothetical protein
MYGVSRRRVLSCLTIAYRNHSMTIKFSSNIYLWNVNLNTSKEKYFVSLQCHTCWVCQPCDIPFLSAVNDCVCVVFIGGVYLEVRVPLATKNRRSHCDAPQKHKFLTKLNVKIAVTPCSFVDGYQPSYESAAFTFYPEDVGISTRLNIVQGAAERTPRFKRVVAMGGVG